MEKRLYYNNCKVSTQKVQNKKKFKRRIIIMKMNKLAAGALALALGLGAVAPAVAAEKDYSGAELFMEKHDEALKEANRLRRIYLEKKEAKELAEKNEKEAKAKVEALEKKLEGLLGEKLRLTNAEDGTDIGLAVAEAYNMKEQRVKLAFDAVLALSASPDSNDYKAYLNESRKRDQLKIDAFAAWEANDPSKADELKIAINAFVVALKDYDATVDKKDEIWKLKEELVAAVAARNVAATKLADAKAAFEKAEKEYNKAYKDLADAAYAYGFLVQIGNNGLKLVKDGEDKIKAPGAKKSQAELIAELKAAIKKNEVAIASAEFLLENAPKSVAKVKDKLLKQIVDAKAIIEKSEKALAKYEKVALVATAYADEATDELEALIKENEDSADAINETIKENEKAQPEVEEEEEKKPEEKEEEEKENKPARQAGTNARTGIAGVAGVAGILAAASVAYAASKRD